MPRRKKSRKTKRSKRSTKGAVGAQTTGQTTYVNPNRNIRSFPDRMITTLRFWEQNTPAWTAESFKFFIYRGTSVYDPRLAAGGLSADGFDQFALIYNTYRVLRSRVIVKVASTSTGAVPMTLIVVPLNVDPGSPSGATIISWANQSYAKMKLAGITVPSTITSSMNTARIYGSEAVNTDDNFSSLVSTNPANNWFWCIAIYANAAITATIPYLVDVMVEYDVQFYDRAVLTDTVARKLRLLREEFSPPHRR